jgi:hypothetical protein
VNGRGLVLFACLLASAGGAGCAAPARAGEGQPAAGAAAASFAVYALSRGRGVPEPTRKAWQAAWTLLEDARRRGDVVRLQRTRLGLEGEVRLCAEFAGLAREREMLERVRALAQGVELLNIVEEPCSGQ